MANILWFYLAELIIIQVPKEMALLIDDVHICSICLGYSEE